MECSGIAGRSPHVGGVSKQSGPATQHDLLHPASLLANEDHSLAI